MNRIFSGEISPVLKTGVVAGAAGGIAEILFVILYSAFSGTSAAAVARGVALDKAPAPPAKSFGGQVRQTFTSIRAYEASMTEYQAKRLAASPDVAYVEQNQTVSLLATQANATWGLDRIDQANRPLSTTYTYNTTGSGVRA